MCWSPARREVDVGTPRTATLGKLAEACGALPEGNAALVLTGLTDNSRSVRPGFLFAAVPGARQDGAAFIHDALQRGAAALMVQGDLPTPAGVPVIHTNNLRGALAQAAACFFGRPSDALSCVGITGTNGKTTVAWLTDHLLSRRCVQCALFGTILYRMGERIIPAGRTTPGPVEMQKMLADALAAGCTHAVMEVSSHALHQQRVDGVRFLFTVFTNLSHEHLDYHRDLEDYFSAKANLFLKADPSAVHVVHADDPWGRRVLALVPGSRHISYGFGSDCAVRGKIEHTGLSGSRFSVHTPWGDFETSTAMPGAFNVLNCLAAVAVAGAEAGGSVEGLADAIASFQGVPGRMERVSPGNHPLHVFVDYAHTPDALRTLLTAVRNVGSAPVTVVFGCGGDRDRAKRGRMGAVVAEMADYVVVTSDNPRSEDPDSIISEIISGIPEALRSKVTVKANRREALACAVADSPPGSIVLAAGKGHEATMDFAHGVVPFDDRVELRKILGTAS